MCYWAAVREHVPLRLMNGGNSPEPPGEMLSRFPRSGGAIRTLFEANEEFRELCGDYTECLAVIDRLRRGQDAVDERIEQYHELRVNLENELLSWISRPRGPTADLVRAAIYALGTTQKNTSKPSSKPKLTDALRVSTFLVEDHPANHYQPDKERSEVPGDDIDESTAE